MKRGCGRSVDGRKRKMSKKGGEFPHMGTTSDKESENIYLSAEETPEMETNSGPEDDEETEEIPSLTRAFQERVRPFIDLIDRLRQFGLDKDVGLPAVVVIGDQSAGKSSALEAISGIQLPRGSGIVTRCPLELRLKCHGNQDHWKGRISYTKKNEEFSHVILNPKDVGEHVVDAQNVLAGRRKGITEDLITLEVEAHDIPDLTLIDLPGITRIAVQDQPEDIGDQIKHLIMKYIRKPETIILAVVPANVDIATNEALKLAMEVDPSGERTLGVVTKPDLIDRGTESELKAVVNNMRFRLAKGYTVVKCRGQRAIDEGQTLAQAMKEELQFFANHESLSELDPLLCGVKNLSIKLTNELVNQIKNTLPVLKEEVKYHLHEAQNEMQEMGAGIPTEPSQQTLFLTQLLDSFVNSFSKVSKGEYDGLDRKLRLYTQARDHYKTFAEEIWSNMPGGKADDYMINRIREEIDQQRGRELPRVWKYSILEMFIREKLNIYHDPAYHCLAKVNSSLENVLTRLATNKLERFPQLEMEIKTLINELRFKAFSTCEDKIKEMFAMENLIFSQDPTYLDRLDALQEARRKEEEKQSQSGLVTNISTPIMRVSQSIEQQVKSTMSRYENHKGEEAKTMQEAIIAYLEVATHRLLDLIPMIITYQLLECLDKEIRAQVLNLRTQSSTLSLLQEDQLVAHNRAMLANKISRLTQATRELAKF